MSNLHAFFIELIRKPTSENYLRAWEALASCPDYNPYGGELREIEQLLAARKFQEARDACHIAMAGWILSPRMHRLAGFAAHHLDDPHTAEMENLFSARLIEAVQATGDGSDSRPFLVSCTSDELDVIGALGKTPGRQSLLKRNGKVIDRIHCDDGPTLHFNITRAYNHLALQMVGAKMRQNPVVAKESEDQTLP